MPIIPEGTRCQYDPGDLFAGIGPVHDQKCLSGGRPVRRLLLFHFAAAAIFSLLLVSSGCGLCGVRHGMILRGDWSLEMNRVPWLNSHSRTAVDSGQSDCGDTMVAAPAAACVGGPSGSSAVHQTAHRGVGCRHASPACSSCAASVQPAAEPQKTAHSRFHPIPTRPVFTPWNCPKPAAPRAAPKAPSAPVAPELIPTPPAAKAAMRPTRADSQVASTAWIFAPSEAASASVAQRR
jgi:hypothetical protein